MHSRKTKTEYSLMRSCTTTLTAQAWAGPTSIPRGAVWGGSSTYGFEAEPFQQWGLGTDMMIGLGRAAGDDNTWTLPKEKIKIQHPKSTFNKIFFVVNKGFSYKFFNLKTCWHQNIVQTRLCQCLPLRGSSLWIYKSVPVHFVNSTQPFRVILDDHRTSTA